MNTALVSVDIQNDYFPDGKMPLTGPVEASQQAARLLDHFRSGQWPVIHVQHMSLEPQSSLREGLPGNAFKPEAQPLEDEPIFRKHVNSAFIGTDLEAHLRARGIDDVSLFAGERPAAEIPAFLSPTVSASHSGRGMVVPYSQPTPAGPKPASLPKFA